MGKTILIVEDQDDLRLLIRMTLMSLGRIVLASSAGQGLERIFKEKPDLVVLDIWLGEGGSGLDVCAAIKACADIRATRVLILSAAGRQDDVEAGMRAGADCYMIKPFTPQGLYKAVAKLLEGSQYTA